MERVSVEYVMYVLRTATVVTRSRGQHTLSQEGEVLGLQQQRLLGTFLRTRLLLGTFHRFQRGINPEMDQGQSHLPPSIGARDRHESFVDHPLPPHPHPLKTPRVYQTSTLGIRTIITEKNGRLCKE